LLVVALREFKLAMQVSRNLKGLISRSEMATLMNLLAWIWQPIAPPLQITACAVVLSGLAIFAYARTFTEHRIASALLLLMRLCIVITLAILLMGPSRMPPQAEQEQRPKLTMLVDTSQSMLTEESSSNTRIGVVKSTWLGREQIDELARDFSVDIYTFDEKTRPAVPSTFRQEDDAVATGRTTRLAQSVTRILSKLNERDSRLYGRYRRSASATRHRAFGSPDAGVSAAR
jgi:hypothetical protein